MHSPVDTRLHDRSQFPSATTEPAVEPIDPWVRITPALANLAITKERTGATLGRADIDRVARRFDLGPSEIAALEARAESAGLISGLDGEDDDPEIREKPGTADLDLLSLFRRDVGAIRLLSADEEVALGDAIAFGREAAAELAGAAGISPEICERLEASAQRGRVAFEEFLRRNVPLVMRIALWNQSKGLDYADLLQIGLMGLMRAIERWDPHRGYRFTTFAYYWIRQTIARGIADTGRMVRLPVHVVESINRIDKARQELTLRLRRAPTIHEIAAATGYDPEKVALYTDLDSSFASLDAPIGEDHDTTLADYQSASSEDPLDIAIRNERDDVLWAQLRRLSKRQQIILIKRFGLDGRSPMTLEQLGEIFGLTRERIRQIEAKALTQLRTYASIPKFKEVLAS